MSNQEILEKAIQKAMDGGWKLDLPAVSVRETFTGSGELEVGYLIHYMGSEWWSEDHDTYSANDIIFNHDFAKALWGAETLSPYYGDFEALTAPDLLWEWHLQQMVIAEDPIEYLEDNI